VIVKPNGEVQIRKPVANENGDIVNGNKEVVGNVNKPVKVEVKMPQTPEESEYIRKFKEDNQGTTLSDGEILVTYKPSTLSSKVHSFNGYDIDVNNAPIRIPDNAVITDQIKTGYSQVKFTWNESGYKYEARWHTRTPGAPVEQGNTWVITKTKPGSSTGTPRLEYIMTGENQWTTMSDWQNAIAARKAGTITPAQERILEKGHWPAN
jgi:hypothetical protein